MKITSLSFTPNDSIDIKKRLEERAKSTMHNVNLALTSKKEFIVHLNGLQAVSYVKTLCKLFDAAYKNLPIESDFVGDAITTFVEEIHTLNKLNQLYEIDHWNPDNGELSFRSLASIDLDIRTGMPILVDLNLKIESAEKDSEAPRIDIIEKFFKNLIDRPDEKPTATAYLQLLREANKNNLASIVFPEVLTSNKLKIKDIRSDNIINLGYYQYGINTNSFEFILINLFKYDIFPKRGIIGRLCYRDMFKEKKVKGEFKIIIDDELKKFFKTQITNDAKFIYLQMRQLLNERFGLDVGLFSVDTVSFGIQTPFVGSPDRKFVFPELGEMQFKTEDRLFIRYHYFLGDADGTTIRNEVKYKIIETNSKCQME